MTGPRLTISYIDDHVEISAAVSDRDKDLKPEISGFVRLGLLPPLELKERELDIDDAKDAFGRALAAVTGGQK